MRSVFRQGAALRHIRLKFSNPQLQVGLGYHAREKAKPGAAVG
jgi:hypothetical protein